MMNMVPRRPKARGSDVHVNRERKAVSLQELCLRNGYPYDAIARSKPTHRRTCLECYLNRYGGGSYRDNDIDCKGDP